MEFILDAGKAVTCANLINQINPCFNLYCQNCIVNFMQEKHNYEEEDMVDDIDDDDEKMIEPSSKKCDSVTDDK